MHIVVPAYNEAKIIASVIDGIKEAVPGAIIIVVDDGSTDETCVEATRRGAKVLKHIVNRGQGAALKTGTDFAVINGAEYIGHFVGDGQFDAGDIEPALDFMKKNGADILFGSRFLNPLLSDSVPWTKRKIILHAAKIVNYIFT